jgi:hypothetical protein
MNAHSRSLEIDYLVTGHDEEAAQRAKDLEGPMVKKYQPAWNDRLK